MTNRVDFDKFTTNYNDLLSRETRFFSSSEVYFARYKVDLVRDHVHIRVNRLLEYGCGIGRNIPFLQNTFPNAVVVGSDISKASLEVARRDNEGVDFFEESDNVSPMEPFDLIFVAGVFHHIPLEQRPKVANTLFRRLAPGGRLFVFEHNPFNPITRRIVNNCPYDEDAILLRPAELTATLRHAGFVIQRHSFCLFVPPRFSMLSQIEKWLGWIPLGGQYWVQARHP